eukprot:296418-Rhodomonas_salina.1
MCRSPGPNLITPSGPSRLSSSLSSSTSTGVRAFCSPRSSSSTSPGPSERAERSSKRAAPGLRGTALRSWRACSSAASVLATSSKASSLPRRSSAAREEQARRRSQRTGACAGSMSLDARLSEQSDAGRRAAAGAPDSETAHDERSTERRRERCARAVTTHAKPAAPSALSL